MSLWPSIFVSVESTNIVNESKAQSDWHLGLKFSRISFGRCDKNLLMYCNVPSHAPCFTIPFTLLSFPPEVVYIYTVMHASAPSGISHHITLQVSWFTAVHFELRAKRQRWVLEVCGCSHALGSTLILFTFEEQTCLLKPKAEGRLKWSQGFSPCGIQKMLFIFFFSLIGLNFLVLSYWEIIT